MGEKTAGVGHFTIPTMPAAGTGVTSGAANTLTTTYVALGTSAAAIYITGIVTEALVSTAVPTYCAVQIASGTTGAETIIDQQNLPIMMVGNVGATGLRIGSYVPIIPPVPVATTVRLAAKTADSVGSLPWLLQLTCINQSNVVDDGVAVGSVAGAVGSVTGSVGSVVAGVNVTAIAGTTSQGAAGYVGVDWAKINAPTTVQGLTGTTISATQTVATVTGNVVGSVGSVTGAVGSVTAGVNTTSWASGAIPAPNTTGVPIVDTRQLVRQGTAQAGGGTTSIVLDSGASATNNFYNGMVVAIISGTGAPQAGLVTAYTGSTKTATIAPAWPSTPGTTSVFQIFPAIVDLETIAYTANKGAAGYVGVDWSQINAPTTSQGLTGTTISATQTVATVTGNVVGSVGSVTGAVGSISGITFPTNFSALAITTAGAGGKVTTTDTYPTNFTSLAITTGGFVTVGTNNDKTGYALTQSFPANFAATAITAGGAVTVGTNNDKTGYSLTQAFPSNFATMSIDVNGNASITSNVKKNTAFGNFMFLMTDSTNHAPLTGATVTATRSLDGAAFGACANAVSEISSGWYKINLAATDTNANRVALLFTATGADNTNIEINTQP